MIDNILPSASKILVVGDKKLKDRNIGKKIKKLLQAGTLTTLVAVQLLSAAVASPISSYEQVKSLSDKVSTSQPAPSKSYLTDKSEVFENPVFINPLEFSPSGKNFIQENGTIDSFAILKQWEKTDMTPQAIAYLSQILNYTQSPAFVSTKAEKDNVIELANRTKDIFSIQSQEEAMEFIQLHSPNQMEKEGLISAGAMLAGYVDADSSTGYHDVKNYWDDMSILSDRDGYLTTTVNPMDNNMDASLSNVINSMKTSGLSTVKIPLQMWARSENINEVSIKIDALNANMQSATSWEGPVLGFNGRNSIHFGSANENASISMSTISDGDTIMYGRSNAMIHEAIHGLDLQLSYDLGFQNIKTDSTPQKAKEISIGVVGFPSTLTEIVVDGSSKPTQISSEWSDLIANLNSHSYSQEDSFYQSLDDKIENNLFSSEEKEYYNLEYERLAFSFEGYAISKSEDGGISIGYDRLMVDEIPSVEESVSSQPIWEKTFEGLSGWWQEQLDKNIAVNNVESDLSVVPVSAKSILTKKISAQEKNINILPKFQSNKL